MSRCSKPFNRQCTQGKLTLTKISYIQQISANDLFWEQHQLALDVLSLYNKSFTFPDAEYHIKYLHEFLRVETSTPQLIRFRQLYSLHPGLEHSVLRYQDVYLSLAASPGCWTCQFAFVPHCLIVAFGKCLIAPICQSQDQIDQLEYSVSYLKDLLGQQLDHKGYIYLAVTTHF